MPDIDVDFCVNRRGEVIDYVNRLYGSDHVAQIVTFGTMAARGAIRDVGRALSVSYAETDAVGKVPADGWFYNGASYTDAAAVSSWAKQAVEYCSMMGVVSGKDGGRFDPKGSAQRCEFAAMIDRFAA